MKDDEGLRQRSTHNISDPDKQKNGASASSLELDTTTATTTTSTTTESQSMVRRGPVLAYSRGGNHVVASRQTLSNYKNKILIALGATILYTAFLYRSGGARSFLGMSKMASDRVLTVASWNVAAINNVSRRRHG